MGTAFTIRTRPGVIAVRDDPDTQPKLVPWVGTPDINPRKEHKGQQRVPDASNGHQD